MSIIVSPHCTVPASSDCRTARPVSSTAVGYSALNGCNHLLGYAMGGMRWFQNCDGTSKGSSPVYRAKIHRHANCDYLLVSYLLRVVTGQADATVAIKAGTGDTQTRTYRVAGSWSSWEFVTVPWGAEDSGVLEVSITCTNISLASFSVMDLPRGELTTGDTYCEVLDSTHRRIGCAEGRAIGESDACPPHGLITDIEQALVLYRPTIFAWSSGTGKTFTADAPGDDIFGTALTKHLHRSKKTSDATVNVEWYFYSKISAGEYKFVVSSATAGDSQATATLSNTSAAWQSALTVAGDVGADETWTPNATRVSGSGTITVYAVTAVATALTI